MQESNRTLAFAIYMTPDGPTIDNRLEPLLCLKLLGSACEDLRMRVAVEQVAKLAAAAQEQSQSRIQVVPANGVPHPPKVA